MPTTPDTRETARHILKIIPLVMRSVAAQLRASGELPAPAHFALLSMLAAQPRTLSELAALQGVSLPTMSNSVTAMVRRGWVRRVARPGDRRVAIIEVTAIGRTALERVGKAAETHIATLLAPLDAEERHKIQEGLDVLQRFFATPPCSPAAPERRSRRVPRPA